jgi:hypothetical protein
MKEKVILVISVRQYFFSYLQRIIEDLSKHCEGESTLKTFHCIWAHYCDHKKDTIIKLNHFSL